MGLKVIHSKVPSSGSIKELETQYKVIQTILKCKGFSNKQIFKIRNFRQTEELERKRFLCKTVYNEVSERHKYVVKTFMSCNINKEKYYKPREITGKKLERMIFTVRKMRKILDF